MCLLVDFVVACFYICYCGSLKAIWDMPRNALNMIILLIYFRRLPAATTSVDNKIEIDAPTFS